MTHTEEHHRTHGLQAYLVNPAGATQGINQGPNTLENVQAIKSQIVE